MLLLLLLLLLCDVTGVSEDGVLLRQWNSISASRTRARSGTSSAAHAKSDTSAFATVEYDNIMPPTSAHVLLTVCLWATSLCIAIGFDDVSVVLALSGELTNVAYKTYIVYVCDVRFQFFRFYALTQ